MHVTNAAEAREQLLEIVAWIDRTMAAVAPAEPSIPVLPAVGLQNPTAFYDYIRGDQGELFPVMRESQLFGVESILAEATGRLPLSWCAYCLATAYHETAKTMQGVKEGLNLSDAWRQKNLRYYPWYGRGLVQLTWEKNYKLATERLRELGYEVDLIAHPDQALNLGVAAVVLIVGMLEGWFTGKKLRDYLPNEPTRAQYAAARKIINGTDKADLIAGYAMEFEKALKLGDWK